MPFLILSPAQIENGNMGRSDPWDFLGQEEYTVIGLF